jgi:signal transduction histidine kinase
MSLAMHLLSLTRALVFVVMLTPYIIATRENGGLLALYAISAGFFVASSTVVVGWVPSTKRWRLAALWGETALVTLLNGAVVWHRLDGPMQVLFAPVLTSIFLVMGPRLALPALAANLAGWVLTSLPAWLSRPQAYLESGMYATFLLFAGSAGLLLRNLKDEKEHSETLLRQVTQSQAALERAHRQLQASAARQQEMAVLEERQRLARDIHDGVAHSLTALVVQAQAGRRLLGRAPEEAAAAVARVEGLAREALQETRRAVRALHPSGLEQLTEVEALRRLGRDFAAATGIRVEMDADEPAGALPPDPVRLEQLYRIFQEALTNAHRHGGARSVSVALTVQEGELHCVIRNDGVPPGSLTPGIGLKAMQERVGAMRGTVRFEPQARGLAIHICVPVREEEQR